ncbi:MAG TPA: hypothetical protein VKV15_00520 [Bryobacteraceae bacterium]|nr:hypothetical protein [Bryobacteraceae bacterium]
MARQNKVACFCSGLRYGALNGAPLRSGQNRNRTTPSNQPNSTYVGFGSKSNLQKECYTNKLTTPLSLDNLWRRSMQPPLEKIGLDWATFQVLRKTNASLSKTAGVDPKVASDQRGHGLVHRPVNPL